MGLSTEGNLRFKIDWASLIAGSKFTVFALFYFVFIFEGAYSRRGFTEGPTSPGQFHCSSFFCCCCCHSRSKRDFQNIGICLLLFVIFNRRVHECRNGRENQRSLASLSYEENTLHIFWRLSSCFLYESPPGPFVCFR